MKEKYWRNLFYSPPERYSLVNFIPNKREITTPPGFEGVGESFPLKCTISIILEEGESSRIEGSNFLGKKYVIFNCPKSPKEEEDLTGQNYILLTSREDANCVPGTLGNDVIPIKLEIWNDAVLVCALGVHLNPLRNDIIPLIVNNVVSSLRGACFSPTRSDVVSQRAKGHY